MLRVIKIKKSFTNDKKQVVKYYEFYIELENGYRIHIKPFVCQINGETITTYQSLSQIAYEVER